MQDLATVNPCMKIDSKGSNSSPGTEAALPTSCDGSLEIYSWSHGPRRMSPRNRLAENTSVQLQRTVNVLINSLERYRPGLHLQCMLLRLDALNTLKKTTTAEDIKTHLWTIILPSFPVYACSLQTSIHPLLPSLPLSLCLSLQDAEGVLAR